MGPVVVTGQLPEVGGSSTGRVQGWVHGCDWERDQGWVRVGSGVGPDAGARPRAGQGKGPGRSRTLDPPLPSLPRLMLFWTGFCCGSCLLTFQRPPVRTHAHARARGRGGNRDVVTRSPWQRTVITAVSVGLVQYAVDTGAEN